MLSLRDTASGLRGVARPDVSGVGPWRFCCWAPALAAVGRRSGEERLVGSRPAKSGAETGVQASKAQRPNAESSWWKLPVAKSLWPGVGVLFIMLAPSSRWEVGAGPIKGGTLKSKLDGLSANADEVAVAVCRNRSASQRSPRAAVKA